MGNNKRIKRKPNVYWHKCKNCGAKNAEYHIKQTGPHYGLYCSICGQWVKWLKQNELLHTSSSKNINKIFDKDYKETDVYTALNLEKPKPLSEYVNVDTLSEEELNKLDLPF